MRQNGTAGIDCLGASEASAALEVELLRAANRAYPVD
jgi:hypothetical protein